MSNGPLLAKLAVTVVMLAKASSENDVRQKVTHAWDASKEGSISAESFGKWARAFLKDPADVAAEDYVACYEEMQVVTGSTPLSVKLGIKKLWERVDEIKDGEQTAMAELDKTQKATRVAKRRGGRRERDTRQTAASEVHRRCEAEATAATTSRRDSGLQRHGKGHHRRQTQAQGRR